VVGKRRARKFLDTSSAEDAENIFGELVKQTKK